MKSNNVSIKKSTLWKGASGILGFFTVKGNFSGGLTADAIAAGDDGIAEVTTILQGFQYQPDPINTCSIRRSYYG